MRRLEHSEYRPAGLAHAPFVSLPFLPMIHSSALISSDRDIHRGMIKPSEFQDQVMALIQRESAKTAYVR